MFTNFVLNTDTPSNPWVVVNTTDRFAARKQLLQVFCRQLDAFTDARRRLDGRRRCCGLIGPAAVEPEDLETPGIAMSQMADWKTKKGLSLQTVVALMGLLILLFYYCEHTSFGDNIYVFTKHEVGELEGGD